MRWCATLEPGLWRQLGADIEIGGFTIRGRSMVGWSAHLAGRDPNTWADPFRFDPDRFVDPTDDQQAAMRVA